jgi:Protein of unknown function (DUF3431)
MRSKVHQSRHLLLSTLVLMCLAWVFYISYFRHSKHLVDSIESADPDKSDGIKHESKDKKILSNEGDLLDNEQLSRLNNITSGLLTRKDVEVVVSRHNEDIRWSDMYASIRTVYEKSDEPNVLKVGTPGNVVRLANLGRKSHTYLTHIVNNYGTLAELTVFSQGSAPTHKIHRKANSTLHDFVLNEKGHFIFTGAIWLPTMAHILRTGKGYFDLQN